MKSVDEWIKDILSKSVSVRGEENGNTVIEFLRTTVLYDILARIQQDAISSIPADLLERKVSDERLVEINQKYELTTNGNWTKAYFQDSLDSPNGVGIISDIGQWIIQAQDGNFKRADGDCEFIAHSHQDIPDLIHDYNNMLRILNDVMQDGSLESREDIRRIAKQEERERLMELLEERKSYLMEFRLAKIPSDKSNINMLVSEINGLLGEFKEVEVIR